jgi:uncharacterized protein YpmS
MGWHDKMGEKRNRWKRAFFMLLSFVLILIGITISTAVNLLFSEPEKDVQEQIYSISDNPTFFTLTTTKSAINKWMHDELQKKKQQFDNIHYEVVLDDYIYLKGWLLIFNREIPYKMVFEPTVNKDGGLTLYEKEISLGKLQLPGEIVLGLIQEQMKFPDWVTVNPAEHLIYVDAGGIKLERDLQLTVKEFDLKNDHLKFQLTR